VRDAIERADCIVDATLVKRRECPEPRSDLLSWCLGAKVSLPRSYSQLVPLINRQFHIVAVTGGCGGCTLCVRNTSSRVSATVRPKDRCRSPTKGSCILAERILTSKAAAGLTQHQSQGSPCASVAPIGSCVSAGSLNSHRSRTTKRPTQAMAMPSSWAMSTTAPRTSADWPTNIFSAR